MELVRAELLKVRSTKLWIGMAIGAVGLTGLSTILFLALAHSANAEANGIHPIETTEDLRTLVFQASGTLAFVLVLAATMATTEFRYGTASGTYLAVPSRVRRHHGEVGRGGARRSHVRLGCCGDDGRDRGDLARD
jgi:hypothetical protein